VKPLVVVNFKAYEEGLGKRGELLVDLLDDFPNVILCLPAPLIGEYDDDINVFAQHVDPVDSGAYTGAVTAREIKMVGANGTLLNHSEKRMPFEDIKKAIKILKKHKLKSIVACQNLEEAKKIKRLKPNYIAYEPPELIGGKVSVSTAKPEVIEEIVKAVKPVKVLVGAGVKTHDDVLTSLSLGAKGVLIASGIVKAKNKKQKIKSLIQ